MNFNINCLWKFKEIIIGTHSVTKDHPIRTGTKCRCDIKYNVRPSSVQFSRSVTSDSLQPHGLLHPGFPVHHPLQSLLKLMSIESVMPSNHLILCCPLFLLSSIFPSIRIFSNESVLPIRWPKYWSFSFSISPSNEYSGLIYFRIDWFNILADWIIVHCLFVCVYIYISHSSLRRHLGCFLIFAIVNNTVVNMKVRWSF